MMNVLKRLAAVVMLTLSAVSPVCAEGLMTEDFTVQPDTRWRFFADTVMGGASSGQMRFVQDGTGTHASMTGHVSTENNGGFIQMQMDLPNPPPEGTIGVRLIVRGNDQRYFVHLRTKGTLLPWQYYQAKFDVTHDWTEVRLPLDTFQASGALLRNIPLVGSLTSIGIVAYGRDHDAEIEVREVGFY